MQEAKSPLSIRGMHGMGDCLHQRAVVRQLMQRHDVWLETSWPCIYHDLIEDGLKVIPRPVSLRTQARNSAREANKFSRTIPPRDARSMVVGYTAREINSTPSKTILEVMCSRTGCDFATADFRLPVPTEWATPDICSINGSGKPLMIYRPLCVRPEWSGSAARNADLDQYAELLTEIRDDFFIVSVADLVPGREWIVGPQLKADVILHHGELVFEQLAALFSHADLVFTSGGYATLLAMAVGTPVVSIIGGYERASWASAGSRFSPYLGIEPISPCNCGSSRCRKGCSKTLDITSAAANLRNFLSRICIQTSDKPKANIADTFSPAESGQRADGHPQYAQLRRAMVRQVGEHA